MNYRTHIVSSLSEIGEADWTALLQAQGEDNPFLSYAFLHALHESGSASAKSGWTPRFLALYEGEQLAGAMPLYVKSHSYGEYVFDWTWANAYHELGLRYYPKLLSAIPFTPVTGARLIARSDAVRQALIQQALSLGEESGVSSFHVLFPTAEEASLMEQSGLMLRHGVQFHWLNQDYSSFDEFLGSLEQKKRKNIRAERRKVAEAGVRLKRLRGTELTDEDWDFFNQCYARTYAEHFSTPYLNLEFFLRIGRSMADKVMMVIAEREGRRIAASLVFHSDTTLYGRYWGALEHVPCLHFEAAYYQPLEFCIERGIQAFEGGAQGEHKMARGFLPTRTVSAHWLAHPAFADAIQRFLDRESSGIDGYVDELKEHNPFKHG
jgi:uncharacterized protein